MVDFTKATQSARARRRGEATSKAPAQSSIDDFLGGGGAPLPPPPSAAAMPEPGGYVTDASGVETYDEPALKQRHAVPDGPLSKDDVVLRQQAEERAQKKHPANPLGLADSLDKPPVPMRPSDLDAALSAPRKPGAPDLPFAYGKMVRTTFAFNPDEVYDQINERLTLRKPVKDMGYIELAEELDDAARLHRDASRLLAHAKVTLAEFEADVVAMRGDMRVQATNQLKAEKEEKGGKQITDGDVTARMAMMFPDEYRRQERLQAQAKAMVGHIETLVKVWELRRRELDTMLRECRKA